MATENDPNRPSKEGLEAGRRAFAGRVRSGYWQGYDVLVAVYEERRPFKKLKPSGFLIQFLLRGSNEGEDPDYWGDADYTVESIEELDNSLRNSVIEWVPEDDMEPFLKKYHSEVLRNLLE